MLPEGSEVSAVRNAPAVIVYSPLYGSKKQNIKVQKMKWMLRTVGLHAVTVFKHSYEAESKAHFTL